MAMAITMRMVARIFFFATEVTQGPLSSVHYTHIKRSPKSRCAICSGFEDTAKMSPRSRGTCLADLAGDHKRIQTEKKNKNALQTQILAAAAAAAAAAATCTAATAAATGS